MRLLTCHAAELSLTSEPVAQLLAREWGGSVQAPNGLLRVFQTGFRIDVVDYWEPDPATQGGLIPVVTTGRGQGHWIHLCPDEKQFRVANREKVNSMTLLKPILNVREIPRSLAKLRRELPSLQDFVRQMPEQSEPALLTYLRQGVVCGIYYDWGLTHDVLRPEKSIPDFFQPVLLLTDGRWIWCGATVYYVETYHLCLAPGFVEHAAQNRWTIDPSAVKLNELNCNAFDAHSTSENESSW